MAAEVNVLYELRVDEKRKMEMYKIRGEASQNSQDSISKWAVVKTNEESREKGLEKSRTVGGIETESIDRY